MSRTTTTFDARAHHIHIEFFVKDADGVMRGFDGVIDTGAPKTEFNDAFLKYAGFASSSQSQVSIKPGLQTQKYAKITLPLVRMCGQDIENFEVMVSRFDSSWGIAALIGLDFFRMFRVTIDYKAGQIVTEPY